MHKCRSRWMICLMYNVHVKSRECFCKRPLGSNMCLKFIVYLFSKFPDLLFKPYEIGCCKSSVVGFPFQLDELKACSFGMIQIRRSNLRSPWSWYIKWTNESFTRVDLLGPLMCVIRVILDHWSLSESSQWDSPGQSLLPLYHLCF